MIRCNVTYNHTLAYNDGFETYSWSEVSAGIVDEETTEYAYVNKIVIPSSDWDEFLKQWQR